MSEVRLDSVIANIDTCTVSCTDTSSTILAQGAVLVDAGPVLVARAQDTMVFILETCVVLDDGVAADTFLGQSPNSTLVILGACVHDNIGLVTNAVDSKLAEGYVVSFDLRARSFTYLDSRPINIRNRHPKHKLTCTFTLHENTHHCTVLNLTILNDDFIIWLSTCENRTSSKVHEVRIRYV